MVVFLLDLEKRGNEREFSYRARELLRVFERVHRGVLGSSVMKVMEGRCDGVLRAGSTGAIFFSEHLFGGIWLRVFIYYSQTKLKKHVDRC